MPRTPPTAGHHPGAQPAPATSPQIPGRPVMSNAWSSSCLNQARSVSGKAARTCSTRSAGPDRSPARHRSRRSSRSSQSCAQACDSACSSEPTCPTSPPLGAAIIERLLSPTADGRSADGDSAGIPPNTIQLSGDWHDPPHGQADAAPRCIALLGRCWWSVERTAKLHPLWQMASWLIQG